MVHFDPFLPGKNSPSTEVWPVWTIVPYYAAAVIGGKKEGISIRAERREVGR